jgi:hypothetical protein
MENHSGKMLHELYHHATIPGEYSGREVFTIVRNPYDRMASLYRLLKQKFWGRAGSRWEDTRDMSLAEFVRWCIGRPEPNWKPQRDILATCAQAVKCIRYEDLPDCLACLPMRGGTFPHIDRTDRDGAALTAEAIAAINKHSERDFDFGYWMRYD